MVTTAFHQKLVRNLEMYLIKEAGFTLPGVGYELILFVPNDYFSFNGKSSWIISANALNDKRERFVIQEISTSLQSVLDFEELT